MNCPVCHLEAQLLSTTNVLRNYCQHCDIRFTDDGFGEEGSTLRLMAGRPISIEPPPKKQRELKWIRDAHGNLLLVEVLYEISWMVLGARPWGHDDLQDVIMRDLVRQYPDEKIPDIP
jgi:hypothetical protein